MTIHNDGNHRIIVSKKPIAGFGQAGAFVWIISWIFSFKEIIQFLGEFLFFFA